MLQLLPRKLTYLSGLLALGLSCITVVPVRGCAGVSALLPDGMANSKIFELARSLSLSRV